MSEVRDETAPNCTERPELAPNDRSGRLSPIALILPGSLPIGVDDDGKRELASNSTKWRRRWTQSTSRTLNPGLIQSDRRLSRMRWASDWPEQVVEIFVSILQERPLSSSPTLYCVVGALGHPSSVVDHQQGRWERLHRGCQRGGQNVSPCCETLGGNVFPSVVARLCSPSNTFWPTWSEPPWGTTTSRSASLGAISSKQTIPPRWSRQCVHRRVRIGHLVVHPHVHYNNL